MANRDDGVGRARSDARKVYRWRRRVASELATIHFQPVDRKRGHFAPDRSMLATRLTCREAQGARVKRTFSPSSPQLRKCQAPLARVCTFL
jgi:hypothetical protein